MPGRSRPLPLRLPRRRPLPGRAPEIFDGPDDDLLVDQRDESITAPQMLYFLNSGNVREVARALAARVAGAGDPVGELYLHCFGRPPTADELAEAETYLGGKANSLERYCHALLCSNEFMYLR